MIANQHRDSCDVCLQQKIVVTCACVPLRFCPHFTLVKLLLSFSPHKAIRQLCFETAIYLPN